MSGPDGEIHTTPGHERALQRLRSGWGRMDGKTALVTGSTRGIGLETAVRLAGLGADVLVHGRDPGRGEAALAAVRAASAPSAAPALFTADLSSFSGVRSLAAELRVARPGLDVVVANAGVFSPERCETRDGLELTFAVNVVAPLLLVDGLMPALRAAGSSRIVVLGSASHWTGEMQWEDLQFAAPGSYDGIRAYDQSKLGAIMLTLALARRLEGTGVTAVCLDPGDVATQMLASGWPGLPGIPVELGAVTSVYLATAPDADGVSGVYYEGGKPVPPLAEALEVEAQERLWRVVEGLAGPLDALAA